MPVQCCNHGLVVTHNNIDRAISGYVLFVHLFLTPLWHADEKLMPLLGKRVMITAPRQYAAKLASCLIAAGARPVWVPSITITHIMDPNLSSVSNSCCAPQHVPLSHSSVTQTLASL